MLHSEFFLKNTLFSCMDKSVLIQRDALSSLKISCFTEKALFKYAEDQKLSVRTSKNCVPINHEIQYNSELLECLYSEGSSVVIQGLESHPELALTVLKLAEIYNCEVSVNAYISPIGTQGFPRHWDTHDVIVAQISGKKTWLLDEGPIYNVLEDEIYHELNPQFKNTLHNKKLTTYDFNQGTLAYIPRGTLHEVFTTDSASVHLTVGLRKISIFDRTLASRSNLSWLVPKGSVLRKSVIFNDERADDIFPVVDELLTMYYQSSDMYELSQNKYFKNERVKTIYTNDGYVSLQTFEKVIHIKKHMWNEFIKNPMSHMNSQIYSIMNKNGVLNV